MRSDRSTARQAIIVLATCLGSFASMLSTSATAAAPARAVAPIQPGAPMYGYMGEFPTSNDAATAFASLGFVWRQGSKLFIQAPAHALRGKGARVSAPGIGEFGTVVLYEGEFPVEPIAGCNGDSHCTDDYALVEIDRDKHVYVSPAVRHWGGPTGTIGSSDTRTGDALLFFGQGGGVREVAPARTAALLDDSHYAVTALVAGPVSNGDSGGVFLHRGTGAALATFGGRVTEADDAASTTPVATGVTVSRFLELARENGLDLKLMTAPRTT